jgi:CelD/BcsL family acetyltransferase involved in cellulose biosynthesis
VSGKLRRDLRRRGNKLRQLGPVEFEVSFRGPGVVQAYERFLAVEASGWKGAEGAGTAIALHPRYVDLYRGLLERFAPMGGVEISELRVGGRCVAAQLALIVDGVWYLLKTGYDESLAAMAPGNLLFEKTLERLSADARVSEMNLVSDATWHQTWSPQRQRVSTHFVANRTLRGLATVALLRLKERVSDRRTPAAAVDAMAARADDTLPLPGAREVIHEPVGRP